MAERCHAAHIVDGKVKRETPRCPEYCVDERMYCAQHLHEVMQRVAMVSPVDPSPNGLRWKGHLRGSMLNTRGGMQ